MSDRPSQTLGDWLRAAYAPEAGHPAGCPPPEAFLEAEAEGLPPEARRALDDHAACCPACAAERDLARLFDASPKGADVRPEDLDFVVSRLGKAALPREGVRETARETNVVPFPAPRRVEAVPPRRSRTPLLRFAAAALLVIGLGLGYRAFQSPGPDLPDPQTGEVMRGGEVEVVGPKGEMAEMPSELRWVLMNRAVSYRVRITAVDGAILWEGTVSEPAIHLPEDVAGRLHRAVVYTWTVEALDAQGARLASSEPVRFKVRPDPQAP